MQYRGQNIPKASEKGKEGRKLCVSLRMRWILPCRKRQMHNFITVPLSRRQPRARIIGVQITTGYAKNKKTWKDNSIAKTLLLSINDRKICVVELEDTMDAQIIRFHNLLVSMMVIVRIAVKNVYFVDKYRDTAISEM